MPLQFDPTLTSMFHHLEDEEQSRIVNAIIVSPGRSTIETTVEGHHPIHSHHILTTQILDYLRTVLVAMRLPHMATRIARFEIDARKPYRLPLEKEGAYHQRFAPAARAFYQQKNIILKFIPLPSITAYELFHCLQVVNRIVPQADVVQYLVAHNVQIYFHEVPPDQVRVDVGD